MINVVYNVPYAEQPDPAHDKRCARLRARLIASGYVKPAPPGPRYMSVEQVQAWKVELLRRKLWSPRQPRGWMS